MKLEWSSGKIKSGNACFSQSRDPPAVLRKKNANKFLQKCPATEKSLISTPGQLFFSVLPPESIS